MLRRNFLRLVAAATAGIALATPKTGEIQHWKLGNFGQFIWTGENPRLLAYKGKFPPNLWEDFKQGKNFEDRSDWRAVVKEIDDLPYLLACLKKENWTLIHKD